MKASDDIESFTDLFSSVHAIPGGSFASTSSTSTSRDSIPENTVYMVRANLSLMKVISRQIKSAVAAGVKTHFHICFIPAHSTVCEQLLDDIINSGSSSKPANMIWEKISFCELRLGMIPFDTDILSLEIDDVFKQVISIYGFLCHSFFYYTMLLLLSILFQCYVDGDLSSLNTIASSLLQLQSVYGIIPNIKSKGVGAKKVLQKLFRMRLKQAEEEPDQTTKNPLLSSSSNVQASSFLYECDASGLRQSQRLGQCGGHQRPEIDTLIVIDREVDLVSHLVTPLTYEGLLDEIFSSTRLE